jgi:hypothetical protein
MRHYSKFYNRAPSGCMQPTQSPHTRKHKVTPVVIEYDSIDVFAASVAAYLNHYTYCKDPVNTIDQVTGITTNYNANKIMIKDILADNSFKVIDADREEGELIQSYWRMKMFDSLSGHYVSQFMQASIDTASKDMIRSNDFQAIGIIASMPDSYKRHMKKDELNEIKMDAQLVSVHVGTIGTNFQGEVKILDCRYSNSWGCYYINAIQGNNLFMWSTRNEIIAESIITISGRIKNHRENNVTHLNYVKIKS